MSWKVNLIKHAIVGLFPSKVQEIIRNTKRRFSPHQVPQHIIDWTVENAIYQVEMVKKAGINPKAKRYLELGPGWYPVVPFMFHLAGASSVIIIDKHRLMDDYTFSKTAAFLLQKKELICKRLSLDIEHVERTLNTLKNLSVEDGMNYICGSYLAPVDILDSKLEKNSIDIITSRAVLEHISPTEVSLIFHEFKRIIKKDGVMHHIIDNSDHWQHDDPKISKLNFLKYGNGVYSLIKKAHPQQYMNRLRHKQYIVMLESAGFKISSDDSKPDEKALEELNSLSVHKQFKNFTNEELAIITSFITVKPALPTSIIPLSSFSQSSKLAYA